jgi:hypothetical protein
MEVTPKSKLSQSLGGPVDFALLAEASHSPATLKQVALPEELACRAPVNA